MLRERREGGRNPGEGGEEPLKKLDQNIEKEFPVAMRLGETPVLIPNTKVKT